MRFKLVLILLLLGITANAQVGEDHFIRDLIESIAENAPEDYDLSELQDRLTFYHKHPIDLNHTNPEELNTLFLLSPLQIGNLFEHIKDNGKLIDLLELQSIPEFDIQTIQRLTVFVTLNAKDLVEKITFKNLLHFGDNDLLMRFGRGFEKPKGFTDLPGSRYLGSQERYLMRYKYNFSNRVSASLILEKDAGEFFFNGRKQDPFDYQSAHLAVFSTGRFKKIVIGDYTLQFGQALTLWSGFAFGKSPDVSSIVKKDVGLKPYTSANEYSFLRGLATTFSISDHLEFTPFISYRNLDASLTILPNGESVANTLNQTGLHRTNTEIDNKKSITQQLAGGVLQYQTNLLKFGAIAYHTRYSKQFVPGSSAYQTFNFEGSTLTNLGAYYNYTFKNFYFFGEAAKSLSSGAAFLNGALISLSPTVSAVVFYRNYQKDYHNFFNQASAEASNAFNEKGLYAGLNISPTRAWTFGLYADYFKFPWLKFRVDAPSDGYELLAQLVYTPSKTFKAMLRYKSELKQQNTDLDVPINFLDNVKRETYRGEVNWKLNKSIALQNRVEVSQYKKGDGESEYGFLVYQDVDYSPLSSKISGNVRLAYFDTPSYNSRIYAYEDDVLYNFTFGLYNGKGVRSYLNLKYKLAKKLDLWARYSLYKYIGVTTVGSGLDEITGTRKSEGRIQVRYQF